MREIQKLMAFRKNLLVGDVEMLFIVTEIATRLEAVLLCFHLTECANKTNYGICCNCIKGIKI